MAALPGRVRGSEATLSWFPDPLPAFVRARRAAEDLARAYRQPLADWRDGCVVFACPECPDDDYAGPLCSVCGGERPPA